MNLPLLAAAVFVLVVAAMNVIATIRLIRAPWIERKQKIAQLVFLWLLPVVGFGFVWHFLNEVAPPRVTTDLRSWEEREDEDPHAVDHAGFD